MLIINCNLINNFIWGFFMFSMKKSNNINAGNVIDTLIGEGCKIKGDIVCDNSMKIDGQIFGNILAKSTVIVSKDALIKGDVNSDKLIVYGKIDGNVQSDFLDLKSTAFLQGDITTKVFQCEAGSVYKGTIEMDDIILEEDDMDDQVNPLLPNE